MPGLFIGHGNPMNAIEENLFVRGLPLDFRRQGRTSLSIETPSLGKMNAERRFRAANTPRRSSDEELEFHAQGDWC